MYIFPKAYQFLLINFEYPYFSCLYKPVNIKGKSQNSVRTPQLLNKYDS